MQYFDAVGRRKKSVARVRVKKRIKKAWIPYSWPKNGRKKETGSAKSKKEIPIL